MNEDINKTIAVLRGRLDRLHDAVSNAKGRAESQEFIQMLSEEADALTDAIEAMEELEKTRAMLAAISEHTKIRFFGRYDCLFSDWGWAVVDMETGKYVEKSKGTDPRWYATIEEMFEALGGG
jgi:hypothetical protein